MRKQKPQDHFYGRRDAARPTDKTNRARLLSPAATSGQSLYSAVDNDNVDIDLYAIDRRYHAALEHRQQWHNLWQDCYHYTLPQHDMFTGAPWAQQQPVYDSTAVMAVESMAAGLVADMLPSGHRWFAMQGKQPNAAPTSMRDQATATITNISPTEDIESVAVHLADQLQQSNFYLEMHQAMIDLVVAGTAVLSVETAQDDSAGGFHFRAIPLTQIALEHNPSAHHLGAVFKESRLPLSAIVARYEAGLARDIATPAHIPTEPRDGEEMNGQEEDSNTIMMAADDSFLHQQTNNFLSALRAHARAHVGNAPQKTDETEEWLPVVEALLPDGDRTDYILFLPSAEGGPEPLLVARGQFRYMPLLVFRLLKAPGEIYGRSPVMRALPDIKTANQVVALILKNASLSVSGMWLADDDGVMNINNLKLEPGAIIQKAVGSAGLTPLRTAPLDLSQVVLADLRQNIRRALLADNLLTPEVMASVSRTATQINQMGESQLRLLAASYNRLQHELLLPLLKRLLWLMVQQGTAPLWVLDDKQVSLQVMSPIARRQEIQDMQNIFNLIQSAQAVGLDITHNLNKDDLLARLFHYFQLPLAMTTTNNGDGAVNNNRTPPNNAPPDNNRAG